MILRLRVREVLRVAALALAAISPPAVVPAVAQSRSDQIAADATLRADRPGPVISRDIFGQFAEHLGAGIYGGIWVGADSPIPNTRGYRNDVIAALRKLSVPLVRWPGGCFADTYHWRDGIGPRATRPARLNAFWGTVEPNSFGTHEFMDFVELIGARAYVNGNVGTSSPGEMADWVEYMTGPAGSLADERARNGHKAPWAIAYWGIGNELWGCGGRMRADYAADLTKRFGQFILFADTKRPQLVASGPDAADYSWTETMMREAGSRIDALALHYYTIPDRKGARGSGTEFDEAAYARTLSKTMQMDELIRHHAAIMDRFDPAKRVNLAIDEWGVLTDVEPDHPPRSLFMQNSLRDAILASLNFDIFIHHADRVRMTAIAQMINVAQSMILTKGGEMVLTPTYYVYEMYRGFQDATALPLEISTPEYRKDGWALPAVSGVAGRDRAGVVHLALTNADAHRTARLPVAIQGLRPTKVSGRILTAATVTAHNQFGRPEAVSPQPFRGASLEGNRLWIELPPHSIVVLDLTAPS